MVSASPRVTVSLCSEALSGGCPKRVRRIRSTSSSSQRFAGTCSTREHLRWTRSEVLFAGYPKYLLLDISLLATSQCFQLPNRTIVEGRKQVLIFVDSCV